MSRDINNTIKTDENRFGEVTKCSDPHPPSPTPLPSMRDAIMHQSRLDIGSIHYDILKKLLFKNNA